jgi:ankyrin repeat protein
MQPEASFNTVTIISPSIDRHSLNKPTIIADYALPFSWIYQIKLDSVWQSLNHSQELTQWKGPSKAQLDAILYPSQQSSAHDAHGSHITVLPSYTIASLVNNVSAVGQTISNDAYTLLKALPMNVVSHGLRTLPTPVLEALRERAFATAIKFGDVGLVSTMLELNVDPRERIMMEWPHESTPTYPLEFAVAAGHFSAAELLISRMCQSATQLQLDQLLNHVLKGEELNTAFGELSRFKHSETIKLICTVLAAGASPVKACLGSSVDALPLAFLKKLVDATAAGIIAWLHLGLLEHYIDGIDAGGGYRSSFQQRESLAIDVVRFVLHDCQHLPTENPQLTISIFKALHAAIAGRNKTIVKIILQTISLFGYCLEDGESCMNDTHPPIRMDDLILQAFDNADWSLAASLMLATELPQSSGNKHSSTRNYEDALGKKDLALAHSILRSEFETMDRWKLCARGKSIVELAISLEKPDVAVTITRELEDYHNRGIVGLEPLLAHGQSTAVSTLLLGHPVWKHALEAASDYGDFDFLEAKLFSSSAVPFMIYSEDDRPDALTSLDRQICFRAIAFHAIATNDFKLCRWLLQLGMDANELHLLPSDNGDYIVSTLPVMYVEYRFSIRYTFPSLLAIVAERNEMGWMKFLCSEGVSAVDSSALLRAVKCKATPATIRFLLDVAKVKKTPMQQTYGVAALRQAIRNHDFNLIDILCKAVGIDKIEPFIEEILNSDDKSPVSPLGESIVMNSPEIVQFLLNRSADPTAYVSFDGLKMLDNTKSYLYLVTPLLAAIDVQSLPIVKKLVEHGAKLHHPRKPGVLRTPLQRAAEMGSFDIVVYLTQEGATIDTTPAHSGGTALQLAALKGFCGIAAFLLERGADPNYPPAKDDGRTAFEAAAEWGHTDTMSLLMQCSVNLDLEMGDPPESQHERAKRFAEKNGFMASKRFVEHLYRQTLGHQNWGTEMALDWM